MALSDLGKGLLKLPATHYFLLFFYYTKFQRKKTLKIKYEKLEIKFTSVTRRKQVEKEVYEVP